MGSAKAQGVSRGAVRQRTWLREVAKAQRQHSALKAFQQPSHPTTPLGNSNNKGREGKGANTATGNTATANTVPRLLSLQAAALHRCWLIHCNSSSSDTPMEALTTLPPALLGAAILAAPILFLVFYRAVHYFKALQWIAALFPVVYKNTDVTVSDIYIYPVKSCSGHRVEQAEITELGFKHDRRWMVVNEEGNFLTQRQNPLLSLLLPTVVEEANGNVSLKFEGRHAKANVPAIVVPLRRIGSAGPDDFRTVRVWGTAVQYAVDQGDDVAQWLATFLEEDGVRLVYFDSTKSTRSVPSKYRTPSWQTPNAVGFADGFPYLLASRESLDELNSRLDEKLPMNRFRPNIVLKGGPPYLEDRLRAFKLGNNTFFGVKKCSRCRITTTDQATAKAGTMNSEPLKTLKTYRAAASQVYFGNNLIAKVDKKSPQFLKVGDTLKIGKQGRIPPYFPQEESIVNALVYGQT